MEKYFVLNDSLNANTIVKLDGRKQYMYCCGVESKWRKTGVMLQYYNDESEFYDKYTELSPEEADNIIEETTNAYNTMYDGIKGLVADYAEDEYNLQNFVLKKGGFDETEVNIVALAYCFFERQEIKDFIKKNFTKRMKLSVDTLRKCCDLDAERKLIEIRTDYSASNIVKFIVQYKYNKNEITEEKYAIMMEYFDGDIVWLSDKQKQAIRG